MIKVLHASDSLTLSRGFTLVEYLLIVTIISILAAGISPKVRNFYTNYQMDATEQDLIQVIRFAQMRAMQSEGSSPYSVHLASGPHGSFTLYRGTNYATRDTNYDEIHTLINALSLSYTVPDADINFSKLEGITTDIGSVTITWPDGNASKTVSINSYGVADRQ